MTPILEVRHLALVRAIADTGSVTRAAGPLNLTQSALSHALLGLESRLGAPLFLRLGKRMVLTASGERVLAAAHRVLDDLGRTEDELRVLAREGEGVLRLCTQCHTGYYWLPPLVQAFHARHPRVEVQIVVGATDRPVDALLAGEIDLAVLTAAVKDERLLSRPLFDDEMVAVVAPGDPLASREHIEPADFARLHLIVYKADRRYSYVFTRILQPAGVEPGRVSMVPLTEAILEMVKAGMGVGILARWAIEPALASGAVRALRITRRGVIRQWSAATLRDRPEPRWQADFVTLLRGRALPARYGHEAGPHPLNPAARRRAGRSGRPATREGRPPRRP